MMSAGNRSCLVNNSEDLDPQTLHGHFEWLAPTLSGADPNGPREFQAFSLRGTLTFLGNGRACAQPDR
jgi:hypothetical protein